MAVCTSPERVETVPPDPALAGAYAGRIERDRAAAHIPLSEIGTHEGARTAGTPLRHGPGTRLS